MDGGPTDARARGVAAGLGAYLLWGLFPLYWKLLAHVPARELLLHRVVWSALLLVGIFAVTGRLPELFGVLRDGRKVRVLAASAALITVNFFVFIWGVNHDRVTEVSLGYYVNPILNVLLGFVVLRERMTRLQGVAVLLALAGVVNLAVARGAAPWVSLALAGAFGTYGLVRKMAPVEAMVGLTVEMLLLLPFALVGMLFVVAPPFGALTTGGVGQGAIVVASGVVTATPLFLFAFGARRIDLGVVGMLMYLAPTLQLALAVLVYGEPFGPAHAVTFACIWTAMALYVREAFRVSRAASPSPSPSPQASDQSTSYTR